ncbi:ABC transporter G family [Micractinium conductrix]|uniref:ABC transporter G family n=1 Tax=Micractinium conductrix TaxID=554055 RepID=A0A2P6VJ81_9CHLO|nr:ABC transporter G family [Micractinium conductrix]|eukprot:PSC74161.1 ABC transporter G family [Micractinium conductrix]
MRAPLLLCLLLAAGAAVHALDCPPGLTGETCATCESDEACAALSTPDQKYTWCYSNHTFTPETVARSYACSTEDTDFASSISRVAVQCNTQIAKCDFHFAINGYALTCSALQCKFGEDGENAIFCDYTKCSCDSGCPVVNGVSLAYWLDRQTGKTAMDCEDGWPSSLCTIDIDGMNAAPGGFQARCQVGECRTD